MNWKRRALTAAVIVAAMAFSGCSMVKVNEEKDKKLVVAEVNGEKILKEAFLEEYKLQTASYQIPEEQEADVKKDVLDQMVKQKVIMQKAEAAGLKLTDTERTEAREELDKEIKEYADYLKENAKEEEKGQDFQQKAEDTYQNYFTALGITRDQYIERIASDKVLIKYMDEVTSGISVEDKEIQEYYDKQKEAQLEGPSYISYYPVKIVTEPAERTVKHVLIKLSNEDTQAISALRTDKKDKEADELRDEKLKTIKAKADEVLSKAKAGEDFEALIVKYGEDPGMEDEQYKDGYTMLKDDPQMLPAFVEASFKLKEGEISDLVVTDYGYHIIKAYKATDDKVATLDEVKEDIKNAILNSKKAEDFDKKVEEWVKASKVKKYEGRL